MKIETMAVHGGYAPDQTTGSSAVPIYQTAAYQFRDAEHGAKLFALEEEGNIYTRLGNPTTAVLENRVAMMEKATAAVAVSSGQAATTYAICALAKSGDEIVSSAHLYGGSHTLLQFTLKNFGITTKFVDGKDVSAFKKAVTEKTRAIYIEALPNPSLTILDYKEIVKIAKEARIPVIVDNTVPTAYLHNPKDYGANIVVYSLTKYMSGVGTTISGMIVDLGNFDWMNSNVPAMKEPDGAYHGLVMGEAFKNHCGNGNMALAYKIRLDLLRDMGSCLSPMSSFLVLNGLETLAVRMDRHCENARKLVKHLIKSDKIGWINFPGVKETTDEKTYSLAKEYYKKDKDGEPMTSSILTFGVKGGRAAGAKFMDSLKMIRTLVNIGDTKSIATHPASTTHKQLTDEGLKHAGVSEDLIRFSVGIENIDDIVEDIDNALKAI